MKNTVFLFIKNHLIPILIILFFSFPIFIFLWKTKSFSFPENKTLFYILSTAALQSILSLGAVLILALPAALGLVSFLKKKFYFFLEWLYLLPIFLPSIVVAGGVMNWLESWKFSPFGLGPVVLGHTASFTGAVAVILARLFMSKTSPLCRWAEVHGIPRRKLVTALIRFVLKRDFQLLSLAVFCFCWTSFSIPLLAGGEKWKTLEVVIYDFLKIPATWPQALSLLFLEVSLIFILSFLITPSFSSLKSLKPVRILNFKPGILLGLLPCVVIFSGLFEGLFYIPKVLNLDLLWTALISTGFLSLGVGAGVLFFLCLISLYSHRIYLRKFLIGFSTPSIVLTGFSFLIFFDQFVYFSWTAGLIILFLPPLYRFAGESVLKSLFYQIQTARTLGAEFLPIFLKITWPQSIRPFFLLAGVASFWAGGDFALTMMTSQGETNLALLAAGLLGRYRLEEGLAVVWIILILGSLIFLLFRFLAGFFEDKP